jgi:hypothetical protein
MNCKNENDIHAIALAFPAFLRARRARCGPTAFSRLIGAP